MAETSILAHEAAHFGAMAGDWWDPNGASAMLHKLNPVRLRYIRDQIDRLVDRLLEDADIVADRARSTSMIGMVLAGALQRRATMTDPPPADAAAREIADLLLYGLVRR